MAFVSGSLEEFLNEINREEDAWADRQINKWERDVPEEASAVDDILMNPQNAPEPASIEDIQKEIAKIPDYLNGREMSQEEFTNLCDWLAGMKSEFNPESLIVVLKMFIGENEYIIEDLMKGSPKYGEGLEHIIQRFSQIQ